jgi:hypothetical protein
MRLPRKYLLATAHTFERFSRRASHSATKKRPRSYFDSTAGRIDLIPRWNKRLARHPGWICRSGLSPPEAILIL